MSRLRLPFGFCNTTRREGSTVIKEYEGRAARERWRTEAEALADVAGLVNVPRIVELCEEPPVLTMEFVAGEPAAADVTDEKLYRMGVLLKDFQAAYRARTGRVRVHGDFGPNNILIGPDGAIAAVIDWEWSRLGDPITDAAWLEWALRMHYPSSDPAAFYEGYGHLPPWRVRHLSMIDSVTWRAERWVTDPATWQARLAATVALSERVG
jgi:aminoglycoside phosphotransferase (APT) family kinase protein